MRATKSFNSVAAAPESAAVGAAARTPQPATKRADMASMVSKLFFISILSLKWLSDFPEQREHAGARKARGNGGGTEIKIRIK